MSAPVPASVIANPPTRRIYLYALRYLTVLTLPVLSFYSVNQQGMLCFIPLLYAFGLIPLMELLLKPDASNLSETDEQRFLQHPLFDILVYMAAATHLGFFVYFFNIGCYNTGSWISTTGNVTSLGLMCGIFGINVAHELGHRSKRAEQWLAQGLLLTSLYMHFFIEHNRGHHRYVSTDEDPASAPKNMSVYVFWVRSVIGSYLSAWKIQFDQAKKNTQSVWHYRMLWYQVLQVGLVVVIIVIYGWQATVAFLGAALIGILLLETVNYIEHYGLRRQKLSSGRYERVMPWHSWNSDHIIGRLMLFELSRHSDHHYLASRKYQVLRHFEDSPQLPTGYPGMILMALVPPLWFRVVHHRIPSVGSLGAL